MRSVFRNHRRLRERDRWASSGRACGGSGRGGGNGIRNEDFVIPEKTLFIGELGLAGEIRAVSGIEKRINEAASLGFTRCVIPARNRPKGNFPLEIIPAYSLKDVLNKL